MGIKTMLALGVFGAAAAACAVALPKVLKSQWAKDIVKKADAAEAAKADREDSLECAECEYKSFCNVFNVCVKRAKDEEHPWCNGRCWSCGNYEEDEDCDGYEDDDEDDFYKTAARELDELLNDERILTNVDSFGQDDLDDLDDLEEFIADGVDDFDFGEPADEDDFLDEDEFFEEDDGAEFEASFNDDECTSEYMRQNDEEDDIKEGMDEDMVASSVNDNAFDDDSSAADTDADATPVEELT